MLLAVHPSNVSFLPIDIPKDSNHGQPTIIQENIKKNHLQATLNCASWPLEHEKSLAGKKYDKPAQECDQLKKLISEVTSENVGNILSVLKEKVAESKSVRNYQETFSMLARLREKVDLNLEDWLHNANTSQQESLLGIKSDLNEVALTCLDSFAKLDRDGYLTWSWVYEEVIKKFKDSTINIPSCGLSEDCNT